MKNRRRVVHLLFVVAGLLFSISPVLALEKDGIDFFIDPGVKPVDPNPVNAGEVTTLKFTVDLGKKDGQNEDPAANVRSRCIP